MNSHSNKDKKAEITLKNYYTASKEQKEKASSLSLNFLNEHQIRDFTHSFSEFKNLQALIVTANSPCKLDDQFLTEVCLSLPELTLLHISGGITSIPQEITHLQKLTNLHLNNNKLTQLPEEITQLKNLQTLKLNNTQLKELPGGISYLTNLQELELLGAPLKRLPYGFTKFSKLKSLKIDSKELILNGKQEQWFEKYEGQLSQDFRYTLKKEFQVYPTSQKKGHSYSLIDREGIYPSREYNSLVSLLMSKELTKDGLVNLNLSVAKEDFQSLKNLQYLNNSVQELFIYGKGERISKIPQEIGLLKNLSYLNLSIGSLQDFPKEIKNLKNLRYLIISENHFTQFPKILTKLTKLLQIQMRINKVQTLPNEIQNLKSLKWLDLAYNNLVSLPESIGECKELISLDLSNNKLFTLPKSITQLSNLKSLYIGGNPYLRLTHEQQQWMKDTLKMTGFPTKILKKNQNQFDFKNVQSKKPNNLIM